MLDQSADIPEGHLRKSGITIAGKEGLTALP